MYFFDAIKWPILDYATKSQIVIHIEFDIALHIADSILWTPNTCLNT